MGQDLDNDNTESLSCVCKWRVEDVGNGRL